MKIKWAGMAKLQEELGELQQEMGQLQTVLAKLQAYPDGNHPDMRYAEPLLERLVKELGDVSASILFFREVNNISSREVNERIDYKLGRYREWHVKHDGMAGVSIEEEEE